MTIRVFIADDHALMRDGLVALLQAAPDIRIAGHAQDGREALEGIRDTRPDVAVIDLSMPQLSGLEIVRRLSADGAGTRMLVITMHSEEEYVLHAVRAGAHGFLLKDAASTEFVAAVRALAAGREYFGVHAGAVIARDREAPNLGLEDPYRNLTDRERDVFHLLVEGLTTKEVARRLAISAKTAENHRTRVLEKLDCRNVAEAIRYAVRRGLIR